MPKAPLPLPPSPTTIATPEDRRGAQKDNASLRRSTRIRAKPTRSLWCRAPDGCEEQVVFTDPCAQATGCFATHSARFPSRRGKGPSYPSISQHLLTTFSKALPVCKRGLKPKKVLLFRLSWNERRKRTRATRSRSLLQKHCIGSQCQCGQNANAQDENELGAEFSGLVSWPGRTFEGLSREKKADMASSLLMDATLRAEEAGSYIPGRLETDRLPQKQCEHINTGSHLGKLTGPPSATNTDMLPTSSSPYSLIEEQPFVISPQESSFKLQPLTSNESSELLPPVLQANSYSHCTASGLLSQVLQLCAANCNANNFTCSTDHAFQSSCASGSNGQAHSLVEDGLLSKSLDCDFELEQPHNYTSAINMQSLDLVPAYGAENLAEIGEGGECIIDTYNGGIQNVGEICEKTRLSKLRHEIRANRHCDLSEQWLGDLDLNKDPPGKIVKRKKHRPKVLQDAKPKRKSRGRKMEAQSMKETTSCNDGVFASMHEVLVGDANATEMPQGTFDSSCQLSLLKVVDGTSKQYECCDRDSQQALICYGLLDRNSSMQDQMVTMDTFRDNNIENSLDSQNWSLSLPFSNNCLMDRCIRSSPVPGPGKRDIFSASRRRSGQRKGGFALEAFDSTCQPNRWGIQKETAEVFSCLDTGMEHNLYPWTADELTRNQHWTHGRDSGKKVDICMQSKMIGLESKASLASQVTDERMVMEVAYHNFMECNEELQTNSWLDFTSQGSNINYGQLSYQDDTLLGLPCSEYKPQSEASCVSMVINASQPAVPGMLSWNNECLQIVPYDKNREIIVSTPLRKAKKKPRAKVHLDEETNRVWLLLENGGALPEETDYEKARIWEMERAIMKGRVDTFIKLMHAVQGDRRFSQWKGSIVDSIVGAFLTQNVSDHLSSSAFMSLASKFPVGVTKNEVIDLQDTINVDQLLVTENHASSLSLLDLLECNTINGDATMYDIRSSGTTMNAMDSFYPISNSVDSSPTRFNPFTGSRTEASDRVRRRLQFEGADISSAKDHTVDSVAYSINHSNGNHIHIDKDWSLDLVENKNGSGNGGMSLVTLENGQEKDSQLQTVEPNLENFVSGKGKKKLYQVSRITGIERAQIEISQGGYKKGRRDWDFLRRQVTGKSSDEASNLTSTHATQQDAIDWEAVRLARVEEIADAIKERGMHNILSGRIKAFLTRLHEDHCSLDLEWIRKLSVEDARDYLLDIRGLGIKSVECIRLLTLRHLAFPVDTNVGRICVRLGWVPIEPLPEELQLHLLELYPVQETIQKYLWPRLCTLDQRTLYELHYQMITFGKVFCTKSKPNCNSCPLRGDCKHFASAFASSKLLLQSSSTESNMTYPLDLPALPATELNVNESDASMICLGQSWVSSFQQNQICEPIIEEPTTPEHDHEQDIHDIEDLPYIYSKPSDYTDFSQSDYIETICLNGTASHVILFEESNEQERFVFESRCLDSSITSDVPLSQFQDISSELTVEDLACQSRSTGSDLSSGKELIQSEGSITDLSLEKVVDDFQSIVPHVTSNAIVPLSLESVTIPVPKLKNIGRLRTVHYVYEIPDDHLLIRELDAREKDDPSFYLLAIWSPDEVPQSQEEIEQRCGENFCASATFGHDETVNGTLLIPCRTAMRGSFPLNGTFFQVNEVFADHKSSVHPLEVPRSWIWNLRRRFVYFGTSIPNIFRGLSTGEIRSCFWLGHVCVRGFDREKRAPKPLVARLHFPASKQVKTQRRKRSEVNT